MYRIVLVIFLLILPGGLIAQTAGSLRQSLGEERPAPNWARDAVIYHLYVRSFADSNGDGNGDYVGLIGKLDYIRSLGVDAILLLPVVKGNHPEYGGYAPTDYFDSEPDYGSLADFDRLVKAAHARKLRVLVDLPLDLASDHHPYFEQASASRESPYHNYFAWADPPRPKANGYFNQPAWNEAPGVRQYFWSKWGPTVPEWNYQEPKVRQMMLAVGEFWLRHGVDGFRLDSAPALDDQSLEGGPRLSSLGTHVFWKEFTRHLKTIKPDAITIAEVTTNKQADLNAYYADGIDMAYDYPIYYNGLYETLLAGNKAKLAEAVQSKVNELPAGHLGGLFLGNHDVPLQGRIADLMGHDAAHLRMAAMLLFALPGTPFVYYGDEIGLGGAAPNTDHPIRNPMQWSGGQGRGFTTGTPWHPFAADATINVAAQQGAAVSMLETYRRLIRIRRSSPALKHGTYREVPSRSPDVYAFLRESGKERFLVVVNLGKTAEPAAVDLASTGIHQAIVRDRVSGTALEAIDAANAGAYGPNLSPFEGRWLDLASP